MIQKVAMLLGCYIFHAEVTTLFFTDYATGRSLRTSTGNENAHRAWGTAWLRRDLVLCLLSPKYTESTYCIHRAGENCGLTLHVSRHRAKLGMVKDVYLFPSLNLQLVSIGHIGLWWASQLVWVVTSCPHVAAVRIDRRGWPGSSLETLPRAAWRVD